MTTESTARMRALHDAHAPALQRYALRLTGDPALAEDVVQEALLRAWRSPAILAEDDESARRWLFTVVRNLVIDDRRSAWRGRETPTDTLPEDPVADASDAIIDRLLVAEALASLSPEHRRAVVSCYHLGRSVAETAEREGVPPGTIKSRLHYALKALRLALQERGVTR
ncbi:RNA polymerase subunit sigma [Clavibacter michiganensis]|uniref:ECF RNA polymerase sigma factor SigL n=1 Tax=Clavibacter michiganensis TaxID=28447 RepID=A0A251XPQ2_9MICO|nr:MULTISPECIES: sigma-70 family RNA polymerase sigma factor [Clavibacter]OUE07501.1 ECF RNA polymerase sigma factor SigL [Clavibacter michiganensis]PPF52404.1 RNA polymerase subunit sigma [Clavibacter michiganensis]PPF67371.1 RNA polymerase subunit sigma [Clavibacter michiganensis]